MKQKLVTVYLVEEEGRQHGTIEEHLGSYLLDGWVIKQIHPIPVGNAGSSVNSVAWFAVLLER
jgi:hypothetical protein